jgi:predicted DNA-binding protein (MmcQ/YjbR family)
MMRAMADDPAYTRFKKICLALPNTKVTMTWGSPHMRVGDKIFTGWGLEESGESWSFSVKLDKDKQAALVQSDPRFAIAAYTGKYGGTTMTVKKGEENWDEIAALVEEGYWNVAKPEKPEKKEKKEKNPGTGTKKKTAKKTKKR